MSEFDEQLQRMQEKRNSKREVARAARQLKVAQREALRAKKRAENRAKFPDVTEFVDALNGAGFNVRVLSVSGG